jgi:hypothetical protein
VRSLVNLILVAVVSLVALLAPICASVVIPIFSNLVPNADSFFIPMRT